MRRTIELAVSEETDKLILTKKVLDFLNENFDEIKIPALLGTEMHRFIKELTGGRDLFKEKKLRSNKVALSLRDEAKKLIEGADDRLRQTFKIALAGNLIDFGIYNAEVSKVKLRTSLNDELVIDDTKEAKRLLQNSWKLLYLCDNAGEIALDKILIEELINLGLDVIACVKSEPIVNDATLEDAVYVGLNEICEVIPTGTDSVGTAIEECSPEFLEKFYSADVIIAKGQGNYETLNAANLQDKLTGVRIIFILKAKCIPVANALGVDPGSSVVKVCEI
jgi:hypothetical protein